MNRPFCCLFLLLFCCSGVLLAQNDPAPSSKKFDSDKIGFGGNLIVNLSNNFIVLGAAPEVTYEFFDNFRLGTSISYVYSKGRFQNRNGSFREFTDSYYGGSLFARYRIFDMFSAQTEYSLNNFNTFNPFNGEDLGRAWVPSWYVGGGYFQSTGNGNSGLLVSVLWDVIDDPRSRFQNPIIRAGFVVGF